MMCFDNVFELNTRNDYDFDYIRNNAKQLLDKNDAISHYEIYTISMVADIEHRYYNLMKYSKPLEDAWKSPLILDEVPP